jgi:hypothetical protein
MMRTRVAVVIAALDLLAFVVAAMMDPAADYSLLAFLFVGTAAYVSVGLLLVTRVPTNPIGALLLATGTLVAAMVVIRAYGDLGAIQDPPWAGFEPARTIADSMFIYPVVLALVGIPLVFPGGRLPSPRFRSIVVLAFVSMFAWLLGSVFGVHLDVVVLFSVPIAFGGAMLAVSLRFRRGDSIERQQVKWLVAVVIVGTAAVLAALLLSPDFPDLGNALFIVGFVALFALPVVIGIAILRYRLYEIDRIVSRTIAYTAVTGILAALFAWVILVLQAVLATFTQGQTVAVAASTLAVFVLFQPLRHRIQRAVDLRFDRTRYDAERTIRTLGGRLRGDIDLVALRAEIVDTAGTAVRPTSAAIWLRGAAVRDEPRRPRDTVTIPGRHDPTVTST